MVIPFKRTGTNAWLGPTMVPGTGKFSEAIVWACAAEGPNAKEKDKTKVSSLETAEKRNFPFWCVMNANTECSSLSNLF